MPSNVEPNYEGKVVPRKVFENFDRCDDPTVYRTVRKGQSGYSWVGWQVAEPHENEDRERVRQWLLKNGAEERDEYVLFWIGR